MRRVHSTQWSIPLQHINKKSKHRQSLYSIEFGASSDTIRSRADTMLSYGDPDNDNDGGELSPKPMTPRRVKRRSIMARGSHGRHSTGRRSHHTGSSGSVRSKHGSGGGGGGGGDSSSGTYSRSSMRHSRRKYQQNPVTKLLDQQQQQLQYQQQSAKQQLGSFHRIDNLTLTASNLQSLNDDITNNTNHVSQLGNTSKTNNVYYNYRKNIPLDPIYYNTNGAGLLYDKQALDEPSSPTLPPPPPPTGLHGGHYNHSYQHSTTNLNDVGTSGHADELYNNRPPSVRSSYSNFHGSRPLSTGYMPNGNSSTTTENVFAGLSGVNTMRMSPPEPPCTPPLYQQHPLHQQQQQQYLASQSAPSTQPFVPDPAPNYVTTQPNHSGNMAFGKRTASRESIRSMAFLNNGPPAYNLNYHTPPDSETTM
ncbi:dual specificity protein kinase splA isoform X3 [Scaptodrosophila lebanonensis]|uniref:Dual specificity protein kinase splA isoform X3 n=1 Tax=Drosophila lebanonensis TaxID=7225 RepID=A0A6J2T740_DROLE|nr:dual specificity protein kinase splA isoform X3 [Scaptodrosophila lebanonensis]